MTVTICGLDCHSRNRGGLWEKEAWMKHCVIYTDCSMNQWSMPYRQNMEGGKKSCAKGSALGNFTWHSFKMLDRVNKGTVIF